MGLTKKQNKTKNSASVIPKDRKSVLVKAYGEKLMVSEQTAWWGLVSVLEKEGCTWVVFYAGAVKEDDSACFYQENKWALSPHQGISTGSMLHSWQSKLEHKYEQCQTS